MILEFFLGLLCGALIFWFGSKFGTQRKDSPLLKEVLFKVLFNPYQEKWMWTKFNPKTRTWEWHSTALPIEVEKYKNPIYQFTEKMFEQILDDRERRNIND